MEFTLAASLREDVGSGKASRLRRQGQLPGVLYGEGQIGQPISVDTHDFELLLARGAAGKLLQLKVNNGKSETIEHALIKECQRNPVKGNVQHVDFLRVAMDHVVTVNIPVHIINEEKRAHDGAVIELKIHELEVSCLPGNIPNQIQVDISKLAMGTGIHVKDLVLPEGVKSLVAQEEMIVLASAPIAGEATTTTEGAEAPVAGAKK